MMPAAEARRVLQRLDEAGVDVWVDGDWGVDALLGRQTRQHNDLDIAIAHTDAAAARRALESAGYALEDGGSAMNWVMRDGRGHAVDVHLVDFTATRRDGDGVAIHGPGGLAYPVGIADRARPHWGPRGALH